MTTARMRVLVAFDKFKDSLSADDACAVAASTLAKCHPAWHIERCPLTDGGEGFAQILTTAVHGRIVAATTTGPRGAPAKASVGFVTFGDLPAAARTQLDLPSSTPPDALIAILDMASASGLALLSSAERDPWRTTSKGTGELVSFAIREGARAVLLGIGGSATNDLGLGALVALGLKFVSRTGDIILDPTPHRWREIIAIEGQLSPALPPIRIACDVTNPLLGPQGCTATFGPQKGLPASDIPSLDQEVGRLAALLCEHGKQPISSTSKPGAGAAGGIAFGLMTAANARLLPGFSLVSAWLDLDARIAAADLVITGEGRFDETSLGGKGPGALVARARELGRDVQVFAGSLGASLDDAAFHAISPPGLPLEQALREAPQRLQAAIAAEFS